MAKNGIDDLRDHLFLQLERLNDEALQGDDLEAELRKASAIGDLAREVTASAKVEVDYVKAVGAERSGSKLFKGQFLSGAEVPKIGGGGV